MLVLSGMRHGLVVSLDRRAPALVWLICGDGLEPTQEHHRHGTADLEFPPPGGPWEPLLLGGRLVGWAEHAGLAQARRSAEIALQLVEEQRHYLLGRL